MSEMSSLREMSLRRDAWMNEKPSFGDNSNLRLQRDDLVIFQFVANGNEGNKYIDVYRSHMINTGRKAAGGWDITVPRYCPIHSKDEKVLECPYCVAGNNDIKERMSMYFDVNVILHAFMPPVKEGQQHPNWPQEYYEGKVYWKEDVHAFKLWHTSAWRESPLGDICKLAELYRGLHNFTAQLQVVGELKGRRFKVFAIPNSPSLPAERYAAAEAELTIIPDILRSEMATPVSSNPQQGNMQQSQLPTGSVDFGKIAPFSILGTPSNVPTFGVGSSNEPRDNGFVNPSNEGELSPPEDIDSRRPMKSLF